MIKAKSEASKDLIDRVRGSLWGAVLGDVIGAFLEFNRGIDEAKVQQAFKIHGGGMHKLEAGQPTDDSELAYSVGRGLVMGKGVLDLNKIAAQMGNWYLSKPIDVGGTIRKSVPKACNMKEHQAYLVRKGSSECSKTSQSNGTLMAITPMSIWCMNLNPADIFTAIRQYTILIHPNDMVVLTNSFYTYILVYLLKSEISEEEKRTRALQFAKKNIQEYAGAKCDKKNIEQFNRWIETIQKGLHDEEILNSQVCATKKSGWCRVALTYAVYVLLKGGSFRSSIQYILKLKGDTDTNACIAGGLIGACHGFSNLNMPEQVSIIQSWRPKVVKRPDWLVPGNVVQSLATNLIQLAPAELKIKGGSQQYKKKQ